MPGEDVTRILKSLGFDCSTPSPGVFEALPPYWRPDVEIPDDIIEDVARIFGYERLPATFPQGALPAVEPRPLEVLRERVRNLAAGLGFQEIITYTLGDADRLRAFTHPEDSSRANPLAVMNPVASQHTYLRTTLRPSLLDTFAANRHHEESALRLFEIGFEYLPIESDLPHERTVFCAALGGAREGRWNRAAVDQLDFFDAKGSAEAILEALGVPGSFAANATFGLLEGHTAAIAIAKKEVGVVGQVHPDTARKFDIDGPVFLLELWLEDIVEALPERPAYESPSRYPAVHQDIALVVDADTAADRVLSIARSHRSGGIRIRADLFDDYRGAGIPKGKKSLALSLSFRADDRTLTDADVAKLQHGLLRRLEREVGATLRS